jgi:hypothetical protein
LAYSIDRDQDPWRASTKSLNKGWMRKFFVKRSNLAGPSKGTRLKSAYPGRVGARSQFSLGAHDAQSETLDQHAASQLAAKERTESRNYKSGLQPGYLHESVAREDPYMSFQTTGYKSTASFGSQSALKRP